MPMPFAGGFSYGNFFVDLLTLFAFVVWFWLTISVFGDLFRRSDISGWGKALWVIGVILFPYLGVLVYMISQGRGMAKRSGERAQRTREEFRNVIGFSVADEIEKLDRLKSSGSISEDEFARLRSNLLKAA
jgi:Phospholipase_D-nuclease N-terminal